MIPNQPLPPFAARAIRLGGAALLIMLTFASAQSPGIPSSAAPVQEQTAPAIPVDLAALAPEPVPAVTSAPPEITVNESAIPKTDPDGKPITDYTAQIGSGMKERERRLQLLNEAMMKLREAGEMEDAGRVEERIRSLLEMPPPSQAGTRMRSEIEQLRAKNDDLALQLLAMQEELKKYRPANGSNGSRNKGVASADR